MIRLSTTMTRGVRRGAGISLAALAMAACGSSSSGGTTAGNAPGATPTASAGASGPSSGSPATTFSVANVSGLGQAVVDGRGYTVYILTKPGSKNLPCTDGTGCTKYWPDLALPDGTTSATAGSGLHSSLLSSKKLSDGETYATYNGWLMYEYAGDNGPGQSNGQGVKSFGGTWYALSASGKPIDNS